MLETKICTMCGKNKPLTKFNIYHSNGREGKIRARCRECSAIISKCWREKNPSKVKQYKSEHRAYNADYTREHRHATGRTRPIATTKELPQWLGIYIAERVLSGFFDHIIRMPYNNPGYDYICGRGFKIDVKSSCLIHRGKGNSYCWHFHINHNATPDYFLCLAFDDRTNLKPQHIWLIPSNDINHKTSLNITNSDRCLLKWSKYERPLDRVVSCCEEIRERASP